MAFGKKKKEKQLTLEEALDLLKPELAPLWQGSPPLFVAFSPNPGIVPPAIYPLEKSFARKTWLVFFLDPTSFTREMSLNFVKQIFERYSPLGLNAILAIKPSYSYFFTEAAVQGFIGRRKIPFPVVVDKEDQIAQALGMTSVPGYAILPESARIAMLKSSGHEFIKKIELDTRKMLWEFDPGLPLTDPYEAPSLTITDVAKCDFTNAEDVAKEGVIFTGKWETNGDKISTKDPEASVKFKMRGSELALIAESLDERLFQTRILFKINSDADSGANHEFAIDQPKNYLLASGNSGKNKEVTLSFPNAGRIGISLYGFRTGQSVNIPKE